MCMRRRISLSVFLLLGAFFSMGFAQELKVKSFVQVPEDIIARTYPRNDLNDNLCAVIRVGIGLQGVKFSGNVTGEPIYEPGEYVVYMPEGSQKIKVLHADYIPLTVRFADYGIQRLQSGCSYHLTILSEGASQTSLPKVQGNFFIMNITPKQAWVAINGGDPVASSRDGVFKTFLKPGSYTYCVEAEGYDSHSGSFEMAGERITMPINLRSFKAAVTIKSVTSGASIYVNEEFKGIAPWYGSLNPGTYLVEARLDGHRPTKQTVTLSKEEERSFTLPALQPIYGSLMVDFEPMDAEVYVDGKLLGKSPNLFSQVLAGTHQIKVTKKGYTPHSEKITIHENQQGSISGKLMLGSGDGSFASNVSEGISGLAKEEFNVNGVKFGMIRVEGGTFTMGVDPELDSPSDNEKPTRRVTLNTFYIGETEVTQALWKAVMGKSMKDHCTKVQANLLYGEGDNYPMYYISWEDCQEFIKKLNKLTGRKFSLPTEMQWEFAACGGNKSSGTQYNSSRFIDSVAWYKDNSKGETHPVGLKIPNELGLYDMDGNVSEWCHNSDRESSKISNSQLTSVLFSGSTSVPFSVKSTRAMRGGNFQSEARDCLPHRRHYIIKSARSQSIGLRLLLEK